MSNTLEYKGYIGSAEVDAENGILCGRLLFIRDAIGYHGATVDELRQAFHEAVDDYVAACAEHGDEPDVPCKGSFNVRVGSERHRTAALRARQKGIGLNEYVCAALDEAGQAGQTRTVVHRHELVRVVETVKVVSAATAPERWESVGGSSSAPH